MNRTTSFVAAWCAALAPVVAGAVLYELLVRAYVSALVLLLVIVVCMETRVRAGYRLPRGWLFYLHILSGALLLLYLAELVYRAGAGSLPVLLFLYTVMVLTGGVLLARNLTAHALKK